MNLVEGFKAPEAKPNKRLYKRNGVKNDCEKGFLGEEMSTHCFEICLNSVVGDCFQYDISDFSTLFPHLNDYFRLGF